MLWQAVTAGRITFLRHLPIWTTRGMFGPEGTLSRVKLPSEPVIVIATGEPLISDPQALQLAPVVIASNGEFGT